MIDNKKIEDAAKSLRKDFNDDVTQGFLVEFGLEKGAKWAINEFLKDLWHPVSEEPKESIFMLSEYEKGNTTQVISIKIEEAGVTRDLFVGSILVICFQRKKVSLNIRRVLYV